ncbi:Ser/Thr protein kinase RdoA involved in Cpx stress response, MazF antagonist [Paenibacillus uliginis N3/975]|uniref:Ser/Thr protein kinase RdoA involved in Cpx stress response, MazF antagonist n=2 Tax=Paenibacillus TaxID=44249 RepID=A0A1X7H5R0_9BACL|nr:Ser/Thr protein kinase RdoA involved in Cpx stress response, MazF antagonist [Paenibacillus uliginis N3/975]
MCTLSDKALAQYLRTQYSIQNLLNTSYYLRGMNDTYLVTTTSDEKFIFRVYRGDWRKEYSEIAFELELLRHLNQNRISVSLPIADIHGEFIQTIDAPEGRRFSVLFTFAEGSERGIDNEEISSAFGKAVANIHLKGDSFKSDYARPHLNLDYLINQSLDIIEAGMGHRKDDFEFIKEVGKALEQALLDIPLNQLDWGICHGDLHGNTNVSFTEDLVMTHYDFDLCGYGWRAYDIAEFRLAREVRLSHDPEQLERLWSAFIEGYHSIRALSESDLRAVPIFVGIRQLWLMGLCLSDPHITGSIDYGDEFIDEKLDYFKQLKEHLYGSYSEIL